MASTKSWIGASLTRVEDDRFLRGSARFTDDIHEPAAGYGAVVRSPHAHAIIRAIDTRSARGADGVRLVLDGNDCKKHLSGPIPSYNDTSPWDVRNDDGNTLPNGSQPVLADGVVRYAGEAVAFVIADTPDAALAAAELIEVDYEELAVAMTFDDAVAAGAPQLWPDAPGNRSMAISRGDQALVDSAFSSAATVVSCTVQNNRIVPNFMEPRAAIGRYDAATGRYRLDTGCQSTHSQKALLSIVLGIDADQLQVVAPDTGGGFGARNVLYPESILVLLGARLTGRPVKWTATRSEAFLTDVQARDSEIRGELALDDAGRFLAVRVVMDWRHGAYMCPRNAAVVSGFFPPTVGGVYRIAVAHTRINGAFTNTTPQGAYRGIGRLESNYFIERLIDEAATTLGEDPLRLRQLNLVEQHELPWTSPGGAVYTSGEFSENMATAVAMAERASFETRRARSAGAGLLRGQGIGMFIENDGAVQNEFANVDVDPCGRVRFGVGTQDFGMGHRTVFSQVAADSLGLTPDDIDIFYGDTDTIATGFGSAGSRSARLGGSAVVLAAEALVNKAQQVASEVLETAPADLDYVSGEFIVRGTDRRVSLFRLAESFDLSTDARFEADGDVFSNGCHVCEVEVDPQTGVVRIDRHVLVMDAGRALNPMIVHGQLHGGLAQGLGQAAFEHVVYDRQTGQTLSGSFMDYCLPRADDFPAFDTQLNELVEADNPLGVKGAGEGPTTGAPAAYVNAVADALRGPGAEIDMPLTPQRVWQAITRARERSES